MAEYMENERLEHIELEHKLELEKSAQRERVKTINQQQIAMKEDQREKADVAELVRKIEEEERLEVEARDKKKAETQLQLAKFKVEQAERQIQLEQDEQDEND